MDEKNRRLENSIEEQKLSYRELQEELKNNKQKRVQEIMP